MKFSIIIPTLNEEKALPELLGDLTRQIYKDFEVIVVDGKSEDKTKENAVEFKKVINFQFIESKVRDVSYQRNLGVNYADSEWIIFMDADDRLEPDFIKKINDELTKRKRIDAFSCWMKPDSKNIVDALIAFGQSFSGVLLSYTPKPEALGSMIGVKKIVIDKVGGFKEKTYSEDWDFIIKVHKFGYKFTFFINPCYTTSFRRFRKYGLIKVLLVSSRLTIKRIFGMPIDREKEWPMGKY